MMTTTNMQDTSWNESHKERFKTTMEQPWPNQQPRGYALLLDPCLDQLYQQSTTDRTQDHLEVMRQFADHDFNSFEDRWSLFAKSLSKPSSAPCTPRIWHSDSFSCWEAKVFIDNWISAKLPLLTSSRQSFMRLQKGYHPHQQQYSRQSGRNQFDIFLGKPLLDNSGTVKALETKDFGKNFQQLFQHQLFAYILTCANLLQAGKAGGKLSSTASSTDQGQTPNWDTNLYPSEARKLQATRRLLELILSSSSDKFKNHAICGNKTTASYYNGIVNRANCGTKTTPTILANVDDQAFPVLNSEEKDLQALSLWLLQTIVTGELMKSNIRAFTKLLYCAVSVRVLFFVVITIIDQCLKLQQREGDDIKKRSLLALKEKVEVEEKDLLSFSGENNNNINLSGSLVFATFEGQMYANHNAFGYGQMEGDDGEAPFFGGQGGNEEEGEFFEEIPDFGEDAEEEMMDEDDEFERRFRGRSEDVGALRRVPSLSDFPPVDDFLVGEEDGRRGGHGQGGRLAAAEWAQDAIVHHGDIAEILRRIGEEDNDPIPQDPEPGIPGVQLWMEEPWVMEPLFLEVNAANAA